MKGRWLWIVMVANLVALLALAFVYPHLMISPGPLVPEHASLTTDCYACHAPWRGAAPERCIACHALPDIGLRTTKGVPVLRTQSGRPNPLKTPFHQELAEQDCMACHSDHAGPKLTQHSRKPFSHTLLRAATRDRCDTCHAAPANEMHRNLSVGCSQCHRAEAWKPATFDHAALPKAQLGQCETCHKAPADKLHRQIQGNCAQCHASTAWKPATFDHDKLFLLDKDHNASCVTCHTANDYSKYSCYGCHEHTPANIRGKHVEEGIRDFENCVECHRSADGEPKGKGAAEGERGRDGRKRD